MATIKNALQITKLSIKAQQENYDVAKTTILAGKPGIGKTQRMEQLAEQLNMHFFHISAPEISPEHLSGIPDFKDVKGFGKYHANGVEAKATYWSVPEIIYNANTLASDKSKNGTILMLDDIHEAPLATVAYFYQLFNEKKLSNFSLDSKVFLVGAMNDSDQANFDGLPSPVKNRISLIKVDFDPDEWLEGYSKNLHFHIRSFLQSQPKFLNEDETTDLNQFGTPRSWTNLAALYGYSYNEDSTFTLENISDIASSNVSHKATQELEIHVQYLEKLNLNMYVETKKIFNIKDFKSPLDQVLMGYVVNFIHSIEDAQYLSDLLSKNIKSRNFIGFIGAELYSKYESNSCSKGLEFFIDFLLLEDNEEIDISKYGKLTKKEKDIISNFKIEEEHIDTLIEITTVFSGKVN